MAEAERYAAAWRDLRSRRQLILAAIFLYPMVAGFIVLILSTVSQEAAKRIMDGAALGWFLAIVGSNLYRVGFRCPRCHDFYFWRPLVSNIFAGECLNCGLRKGAVDGSET